MYTRFIFNLHISQYYDKLLIISHYNENPFMQQEDPIKWNILQHKHTKLHIIPKKRHSSLSKIHDQRIQL